MIVFQSYHKTKSVQTKFCPWHPKLISFATMLDVSTGPQFFSRRDREPEEGSSLLLHSVEAHNGPVLGQNQSSELGTSIQAFPVGGRNPIF